MPTRLASVILKTDFCSQILASRMAPQQKQSNKKGGSYHAFRKQLGAHQKILQGKLALAVRIVISRSVSSKLAKNLATAIKRRLNIMHTDAEAFWCLKVNKKRF